jgi:fibrillarin-like pre-rRNA processing protein
MKSTRITGVFTHQGKLFTQNHPSSSGIQVYNEKLLTVKENEYRTWNPYRSKLAAAILKELHTITITPESQVLYLGAATGTTVSHISDIVQNGVVYAVENSPIAVKKLLQVSQQRPNVIPILADANHPDTYSTLVPTVDLVYQDISQRNQAEIFLTNLSRYLKKNGYGVLMVKARSIDVALKPKQAYELVTAQLKHEGLTIKQLLPLEPYKKDHACILISP